MTRARRKDESFEDYKVSTRKEESELKEYLRGRIIEGTECDLKPSGRINKHRSDKMSKTHACKQKIRDKKYVKNKMSKKSRRINKRKCG